MTQPCAPAIKNVATSQPVAFGREGGRERMGLHAGAPDDGGGLDALAVIQSRAGCVDRRDRYAAEPFNTQRLQRLLDDRDRFRAHVGADARRAIGQDDARRSDACRPQLARHLRRRLDARQSAAHDQHGRCP